MLETIAKKFAITAICFLVAVLSIKILSGVLTKPDAKFNKLCIESYDDKIETTMKLAAAAASASALISLAPEDMGTPIANELAEISKFFLVVLSALYFEKYFVVIAGFVVSCLAIPLACVGIAIYAWTNKELYQSLAIKALMFGIVIAAIVPCTVVTANLVSDAYNETIENAQAFEVGTEDQENSDDGILKKLVSTGTEVVAKAADYLTDMLEALAVMLVVSCIIPVMVLLIALFILKIMLAQVTAGVKVEFPLADKFKNKLLIGRHDDDLDIDD